MIEIFAHFSGITIGSAIVSDTFQSIGI